MDTTLSLSQPLARRLNAWARERFPVDNILVCSVFFAAAMLAGRASSSDEGAVVVGLADLLALVGAVGFFLMLRVFDEHKDYDADVHNYPDRVLSRGMVTLDHLKGVGAFAIFLQLTASLVADGGIGRATLLWCVLFGYSLLMLKEFFVREWLERRLWLYAATHMVATPMAMLWFVQIGVGQGPLPAFAPALAALSFAAGASFEVTRKTRGPEEERESVQSYSKELGLAGAVATVLVAVTVAAACTAWLLLTLSSSLPLVSLVALGVFTVAAMASILWFAKSPSAQGRERNEKLVGVFLLAVHVCLIAVVIAERGVSWH